VQGCEVTTTTSHVLQGSPGPGNNRYFILKSYNHENIQRAVADGVWATQRHNEVKLNEAFSACANVFLIFSVNMSGHFQVQHLCTFQCCTSDTCSCQAQMSGRLIASDMLIRRHIMSLIAPFL
jgi:YT521-B-like domain